MKASPLRITREIVLRIPKGKSFLINKALSLFGNNFNDTITVDDRRKFFIERVKPIHRELFFTGAFEKDITHIMKSVVEKGDCVFDLGANFGWYTTLLSKLVGDGKVFAFEMGKDIYNELEKNIKINNDKNVVLEGVAIGDSEKEIPYFYFEGDGLANLSEEGIPGEKKPIHDSVHMTTLDNYVQKNSISKIDFIKCDIDGSEVLFLKGAQKSITQYKPIIVIEAVARVQELFGFKPTDILTHLGGYQFFVIEEKYKEVASLPENFSGNILCVPTGRAEEVLSKITKSSI